MLESRSWRQAIWRGWRRRCPKCGRGHLFKSYVSVYDACEACQEELHHHQAHDAPPYVAITVVGHIMVPLVLIVEKAIAPPLWTHFAVWLPATLLLTLWILPRCKGAVVGLQWALRMHGFADGR